MPRAVLQMRQTHRPLGLHQPVGQLARTHGLFRRVPLRDDVRAAHGPEPTEEDVVHRWAEILAVPVNDIVIGIQRAFVAAGERGQIVTSFRYCVPHIQARIREKSETRAGSH